MDLRQELIQYYRWLRRYGLNDSHSGNASVRSGEDIWVTPTGACADTLPLDDLVNGRVDGPAPAGGSLDTPMHQAIYQANPEIGAVLHSHGPYSISMTFDGQDFQPIDFEGQYYFDRIPVLDIPMERYLAESPERVAHELKSRPVAVVRGHGVYVGAESLDRAYKWTCSFESSARLAWLVQVKNAP